MLGDVELIFRGLSAFAAIISMGCALFIARRTENWRNSDGVKAMERRITDIETDCAKIKVRLDQVATKEDLAGLKGEVRALSREVGNVDAGVTRIESFLMGRDK